MFVILVLFLTIVGGGVYYVYKTYTDNVNQPLTDRDDLIEFEIPEGSSVDDVLNLLEDLEIMPPNKSSSFKIYLKINELEQLIQAGLFKIPMNLNMKELAIELQTAGIPDVWVTLPEGLRFDEISEILAEEFGSHEGSTFSKQEFDRLSIDPTYISTLQLPFTPEGGDPISLEGYLFPDRYRFPLESTEELVIETMLDNLRTKIPEDLTYQDLILASMLEREGRNADERAMISDIIRRRLDEGWFLNIDATLLYYYKDWKHVLTQEDLDTDHEYNTYTRIGMPLTPICNPGEVAINAAVNPRTNDYYYYLHEDNGMIHYARTWEEHSANVNTYLR